MPTSPHILPNILGVDSNRWVEACRESRSADDAIRAYRRTFREGSTELAQPAPIAQESESDSAEGPVLKFTQSVPGKHPGDPDLETESVVIPMIGVKGERSHTLCVSSQVGCAMGCTFCETGTMGLLRSLTAAEIVGQWFAARHTLGREIRNIVFMGMGEPLDNLQAVLTAIAVLTDRNGPALATKNISISTVGRLDGLERLAEQVREPGWHRLGLSVSLNAPNDTIRSSIMPLNRAMPMGKLRDALLAFPLYGKNRLCIEYVLIPSVNDAPEHADELCEFLAPLRENVLVNIIPYNPRRDSPWPAPAEADVDAFLAWVIAAGYLCKRRRTKGREMMGACGQLGSRAVRASAKTKQAP